MNKKTTTSLMTQSFLFSNFFENPFQHSLSANLHKKAENFHVMGLISRRTLETQCLRRQKQLMQKQLATVTRCPKFRPFSSKGERNKSSTANFNAELCPNFAENRK
jgi:hypothetical protein